MSTRQLYPSFHFRAKFIFALGVWQKLGLSSIGELVEGDGVDIRFHSVSSLEMTLQTESINEGGRDHYSHQVPVRTNANEITLKRAYTKSSALMHWCKFNFNNPLGVVFPVPVMVELLDTEQQPVVTWQLQNAFPVKWSFSELNAKNSELLIETLVLKCNYLSINNT